MKPTRPATAKRRPGPPPWPVFLGMACASLAHAEAPMHADDAATLAPGAFKIESVVRRDHQVRGGELILGAGALPGLEVEAALSRDRDRQSQPATILRGQGMGVKWVPLQQDSGWSLGARLDLGHARVQDSASERQVAVTALASHRWDAAALHINAGHLTTRAPGVRSHAATWAVGCDLSLAPPLQLTAEIYGERNTRPDKAVGLRHAITDGLKVSTAIGRGNGRTFARAGVAWEF